MVSLAWAVARDRAGLPAVRAPRLHRPRRTTASGRRVLVAAAAPAGRPARGRPSRSSPPRPPATRLRDRPGASSRPRSRPSFAHLYRCRPSELHRPDVTEAQLQATAACDKGGDRVADRGPGQRLALRRDLAPPGVDADGLGDLPARRHRRRAVRRRRRRTEGGQRLLPGAHPDRRRTEPAVAVRRLRRPARPPPRRDNSMQVTRQRARREGPLGLFGRRTAAGPRRRGRHRGPRRRRRRRRLRHDRRLRHRTRSATSTPTACRSPPTSHQAARRAARHAVRQVHGLHGQPGRPLPGRHRHRRSVVAAVFDLSSYKLHLARRHRRRRRPAAHRTTPSARKARRTRPTASSSGCPTRRPHPVPGQRRRHPRRPGPRHDPDRRRPSRRWPAGMAFSPDGSTLYAAVNGQNTRRRDRPGHRHDQADLGRRHRPAPAEFVGTKLYVSNEGGRPAQAGRDHDRLLRHPGARRPVPRHLDDRHASASSTPPTRPRAVGQIDVGLHPTAMYAKDGALFVANTNNDTVSVIDTAKRQGRPDHRDPAVAGGSTVGYEPDAHRR